MAILTSFDRCRPAVFIRRAVALLLLLVLPPAHAGPSEYEIKAAFIYQIARLIEWPQERVGGIPPRLCLQGGNPFGTALDSIRGRALNGREMDVALLDPGADLRGCTLLFIAAPAEKSLDRIVALSRDTGLLTLADTEGFAQRGAMVNFFLENGKVRFEINLEAARRGGLKISSKLLSLARIVE